MLGTLAGIWISVIVFVIGIIIVVGAVLGNSANRLVIGDNSILYIDLSGVIPERCQPGSVMGIISDNGAEKPDGLDEILASIRFASKDEKIKGIYINCGGASLGIASRQEIVDALDDFKKSGKWIYAYGDSYTQSDYFVASAADKLYLNPVGAVDLHGLSVSTYFFKNLLDKLGIEMQVIKVGTYKSAVEPFILTGMSDASRLQTQVYADNIWRSMVETMAANRNIDADRIYEWADKMIFTWPSDSMADMHAVSELKYRNEVENLMKKRLSIDLKDELPLVSPADYMSYHSLDIAGTDENHIAVLYAVGDIVDEGDDGISGAEMVPEILKLAQDDKVKGLVLRVNSGGGSAFASEQIWAALEEFKKTGKPFYVSMGDYAASGGYYISCGADVIYADAQTLTGSIGIFGLIPCLKGLVTDKLGINISVVSTNGNASFPNITSPMTLEQRENMQSRIDRGYEIFTDRVSKGRDMSVDSVKSIAEGRVWDGRSALELGLVDKIGGLRMAVEDMEEKLNMKPDRYVNYPILEENFFQQLLMQTSNMSVAVEGIDTSELREYYDVIRMLKSSTPVQARMEKLELE